MTVTITLNNAKPEMLQRVFTRYAELTLREFCHVIEMKNEFEFDMNDMAVDAVASTVFINLIGNAMAYQAYLDGKKYLDGTAN